MTTPDPALTRPRISLRARAFTLVEMIVVIVIIGVLVAVSAVGYSSVRTNSKKSAAHAVAAQVGKSLQSESAARQKELATWASLNEAGDAPRTPRQVIESEHAGTKVTLAAGNYASPESGREVIDVVVDGIKVPLMLAATVGTLPGVVTDALAVPPPPPLPWYTDEVYANGWVWGYIAWNTPTGRTADKPTREDPKERELEVIEDKLYRVFRTYPDMNAYTTTEQVRSDPRLMYLLQQLIPAGTTDWSVLFRPGRHSTSSPTQLVIRLGYLEHVYQNNSYGWSDYEFNDFRELAPATPREEIDKKMTERLMKWSATPFETLLSSR